jgi:hypothetical protein
VRQTSVIEMTRSGPVWLGSEFDNFLFASIAEDRNGTPLSVLSALARLNVDPWEEAAKLTRLPGETAAQRLASLIAALSDEPSARLDPGTIAIRLVELLPRHGGSNLPSPKTLLDGAVTTNSRVVIYGLLYVIFMAIVLGGQCTMASRRAPAQIDTASAPASSTVLPQAPQ